MTREHASTDPSTSSPPTWDDLGRGLALTLPVLGEAFLVIATKGRRNRFVQFATDPVGGVRMETVSNSYLRSEERLEDEQISALGELGWIPPTHRPHVAPERRQKNGSPNFFRDWAPPVPWEDLARVAVMTLRTVGVSDPASLEYYAWDASGRALSLPALRIARRRKTDPLNEAD